MWKQLSNRWDRAALFSGALDAVRIVIATPLFLIAGLLLWLANKIEPENATEIFDEAARQDWLRKN